jgi:hypothetical protein
VARGPANDKHCYCPRLLVPEKMQDFGDRPGYDMVIGCFDLPNEIFAAFVAQN